MILLYTNQQNRILLLYFFSLLMCVMFYNFIIDLIGEIVFPLEEYFWGKRLKPTWVVPITVMVLQIVVPTTFLSFIQR